MSGIAVPSGIAALYEKNKYINGSARYFRLHREYDRTGIADFENLKADTKYTVRTGSLTIDSTDMDVHVSDINIFDRLPKPDSLGGRPGGFAPGRVSR